MTFQYMCVTDTAVLQRRSFGMHGLPPSPRRPLPAGNVLSLYVDHVPADGAGEVYRLILALMPPSGR